MGGVNQVGFDSNLTAQFTNMIELFNGQLSLSGQSPQNQAMAIIGAADSNGDGRVTAEELSAKFNVPQNVAEAFLGKFDQQGSSPGLDQSELSNALQALAGKPAPQQPSGGNPAGGNSSGGGEGAGAAQGGGGGGKPGMDLEQLLKKLLDTDGDGKVSDEELKAFEKKYGNGDGKLTAEELKEGLKAEAKKGGVELSDDQLNELVGKVSDPENISAQDLSTLVQ